ncbi:hypothetical protein KGY71_03535 [Candidatus Bipolaricaulota bacterium]|nr:hypothetical protein [Candidatus Bipolaricaulota bacterium]
MRKVLIVSIVLMMTAGFVAPVATAEDEEIVETLRSVVKENFALAEEEDLEGYMDMMHPQSPAYQQTRQGMNQMISRYDLEYELLSFTYLGKSGKYQMARVEQKTTDNSEAMFRANITDNLWVFRKQGDQWKGWNTMILEREFLNS